MVTLAPENFKDLQRQAQLAEDIGVDALGIGDSPGYQDTYVSLSVVAVKTTSIRIGPLVTNVITRDPYVTARALASVDTLAGPGRTWVGIGAGDSALASRRSQPVSVDRLRAGIEEIREGWAASGNPPGPVFVASNGPYTQRMAAEHADAVVSGRGCDADSVDDFIGLLSGAERSREPAESWVVCRVSVDDDSDAAIAELLPLLASGANHNFAAKRELDRVDKRYVEPLAELRRRYDYSAHGRRHDNVNAALVDHLGLRDFLASRFALAGPGEHVAHGLKAIADRGVHGVVIPAVGLGVDRLLHRLGTEVLPTLDSLR